MRLSYCIHSALGNRESNPGTSVVIHVTSPLDPFAKICVYQLQKCIIDLQVFKTAAILYCNINIVFVVYVDMTVVEKLGHYLGSSLSHD